MRRRGTVSDWHDERGYGFVAPDGGGRRAFVHVSALPRGRRLAVGDVVEYIDGSDELGRPRALEVAIVRATRPTRIARPGLTRAVVVSSLFLGLVTALALGGAVVVAVLPAYGLLSLAAFWLYASDKRAARSGSWRVAETTLHLVDLMGGWPGGLVARHAMRHKTRKQPFRSIFWGTVATHCAVLVWLVTAKPSLDGLLLLLGL